MALLKIMKTIFEVRKGQKEAQNVQIRGFRNLLPIKIQKNRKKVRGDFTSENADFLKKPAKIIAKTIDPICGFDRLCLPGNGEDGAVRDFSFARFTDLSEAI